MRVEVMINLEQFRAQEEKKNEKNQEEQLEYTFYRNKLVDKFCIKHHNNTWQ